jgi:hypothetical protein
METARIALAPSLLFVGVPSSSRRKRSMPTHEALGDVRVDVLDGLADALAEVALLVAVAQFEGFVLAGGGARGDGGAAERPAAEDDVGFDGGVSAGIEDLAGDNRRDLGHGRPLMKVEG